MPTQAPPELLEIRHSIDNIDAALIHLLAERFKQTRKVGELKAREGSRQPIRPAKPGRSRGCGRSPPKPISIRSSPRSS